MDTFRKALWAGLFATLVLLWITWQQEHTPRHNAIVTPSTLSISPVVPTIPKERRVTFETDTLTGVIDKQGGKLIYLALRQYSQTPYSNKPIVLLDHSNHRYVIAETDLKRPEETIDQHRPLLYHSESTHYTSSETQDTLYIDLSNTTDHICITKRFIIKKGSYQIDVQHCIHNQSQAMYYTALYAQLSQTQPQQSTSWFASTSYDTVVSSNQKVYEKIPLKKLSSHHFTHSTQQGWLSFVEPYFASAWVSKLPISYYSAQKNNLYILGFVGENWSVSPGERTEKTISLYAGPKSESILAKSDPNLPLLVNYGFFWFIAHPLFLLIQYFYYWIGSWGWAIICSAFVFRIGFSKLAANETRNMAAMQQLQPKIQDIDTRYANDPQRSAAAKMALYRQAGVNPMQVGLYSLAQLPIYIAFTRILSESIALRQAPFLWIDDLSIADPYYILPVLFAIIFLANQWVSHHSTNASINFSFIIPSLLFYIVVGPASGFVLWLVVTSLIDTLQKWWLLGKPRPLFLRK